MNSFGDNEESETRQVKRKGNISSGPRPILDQPSYNNNNYKSKVQSTKILLLS